MRYRNRRGFTLIELLAALSISGLAMLGGVMLLDQVSDSSARIVRSGFIAAHEGNGPRVLHQLLLDARVTTDSVDRFRGDERSVHFTSVCQRPGGWMEHCRVSLDLDWRSDSSVLMTSLSTGETFEVVRMLGRAELRFLDPVLKDSRWARQWALSIGMPTAIALVVNRDTSIYLMGASRD